MIDFGGMIILYVVVLAILLGGSHVAFAIRMRRERRQFEVFRQEMAKYRQKRVEMYSKVFWGDE